MIEDKKRGIKIAESPTEAKWEMIKNNTQELASLGDGIATHLLNNQLSGAEE